MCDNSQVSYAHRLDPEAEMGAAAAAANAAKQGSSGVAGPASAEADQPGSSSSPSSPAVVEMAVLDAAGAPAMQNPGAAPAMLSVAPEATAELTQQAATPAAAAANAAAPAAASSTAAAVSRSSPGATALETAARVHRRLRQWHSRQSEADRAAQVDSLAHKGTRQSRLARHPMYIR